MDNMKVTKNLAELCALLVNDIYGELPSRIFATLLDKGRSNCQEICFHTALNPIHVRHGLAVLIQQNLVRHTTEDDRRPFYEADPASAYNLVRIGKVVELVAQEYGDSEAELVQTLAALGNARLLDLEEAYVSRSHVTNGHGHAHTNGNANRNASMDEFSFDIDEPPNVAEQLSASILELLEGDILELCSPLTFSSPTDEREAIEKEIIKTQFAGANPKGARGQEQFLGSVREKLLERREEPTRLKSQLVQKLRSAREMGFGSSKKQKLSNGDGAKTHVSCADVDPSATVRINFEKAAVIMRNRALTKFASDTFGETTGQVYAGALKILGKHIQRCRPDPLLDLTFVDKFGHEQSKTFNEIPTPAVTTLEIVSDLSSDVDVSLGIGKSRGQINVKRAEKLRPDAPRTKLPFIDDDEPDSDDEPDDDGHHGDSDSDEHGDDDIGDDAKPVNGKVFDDAEDLRVEHTRQHLLLLAESAQGFIRHKGEAEGGEWVVDFKPLVEKLQRFEVDSFIEDKFTRWGLRLVNVLREKGKLDDKSLSTVAQMMRPDAIQLLCRMQQYGIAQIQEIPRDNNRQASRTLFFFFFEDEKAHLQMLDNTYKSMLRCHQVVDVQRHRDRETLELFGRSDVKGKEEEKLHKETIDKYSKHLKITGRLMGQIMRLDDMVALFREF